jgi:hypothetical protein
LVCLLALSDDGAPGHNPQLAAALAAALANLGIPAFACTPDLFPDMMAAAIQKQDLDLWAARNDIVTARGEGQSGGFGERNRVKRRQQASEKQT